MDVLVATHGHCFDGLASAALFTHLRRALGGTAARFAYRACGYGGQPLTAASLFTGDENALLDYRLLPSPRLTWYFDHHGTGVTTPEERAHLAAQLASGRYHYEPTYGSCTRLIADRAAAQGVALAGLEPLVAWADRIDVADFATPEAALDRTEPVLQLAAVVEHQGDARLIATLVPALLERPLAEVATSRNVRRRYAPLHERHQRFVERVAASAERRGAAVLVDLSDRPSEVVGKFITYALFPESVYSVIVGRFDNSVRVAVGYNRWNPTPRTVDIGALCARHGGGGHPYVGGLARPVEQLGEARALGRALADFLGGVGPEPGAGGLAFGDTAKPGAGGLAFGDTAEPATGGAGAR